MKPVFEFGLFYNYIFRRNFGVVHHKIIDRCKSVDMQFIAIHVDVDRGQQGWHAAQRGDLVVGQPAAADAGQHGGVLPGHLLARHGEVAADAEAVAEGVRRHAAAAQRRAVVAAAYGLLLLNLRRTADRRVRLMLGALGSYVDEIDPEFVRLVYGTSPLHDIGKVRLVHTVGSQYGDIILEARNGSEIWLTDSKVTMGGVPVPGPLARSFIGDINPVYVFDRERKWPLRVQVASIQTRDNKVDVSGDLIFVPATVKRIGAR